jgi:PAS domain S-box-containing protein
MNAADSIQRLRLGDHLCCIYENDEEHRAILTPFIRSGLEREHKLLYVVDARTAETVFGYLEQDGLDPEAYRRSGRLVVADSRETYTRGGAFDPDSMLELLQAETDKAMAEGYEALRVTGEMSWALRGLPGSERLMEYEGKLNQFFPDKPCIGMCQYDMRRFEPEVLLDVLATHPIAIVRTQAFDNMYYMPPDEFLGPDRTGAELRRRIQNLEERQRNEEELRLREAEARREAEFSNAILDTAAALIVVLDPEGRIRRFNQTCEKLTGYQEEEVLGRSFWETLLPGDEIQEARRVFNQLTAGNYPNRWENEWVSRSGDRIRVAWSNTCLLDEQGRVEHVVGIGLDVTEIALMEQARRREQASLETYSCDPGTSATASSLGVSSLRSSQEQAFQELAEQFRSVLEQSMEQNLYKVEHHVSDTLRSMARRFGRLNAGPRDVIQVYLRALDEKTRKVSRSKARAFTDEGRLLLVELMGYLAGHYQNHCLGAAAQGEEAQGGGP